jgi:hypothetical protein
LIVVVFNQEDFDWSQIYSETYSNNVLDPTKWTIETGFPQLNSELQCFTNLPSNIQMANNLLTIKINQ